MKHLIWIMLCAAAVGCTSTPATAPATEPSATYEIHEAVAVDCSSEMEWIQRYEKTDIAALKERAQSQEKECDVMFFGSSSIRLWETLEEDMAPLKVVNRGYGGATLRDLHYNYPTVMDTYRPKAFVIYCDNDLKGKAGDLLIGELFDHYRVLLARLAMDYPDTPVFVLAMKHSLHRLKARDKQRLFNDLMSDYAAGTENLTFVDTCSPLLNADGSVDDTLFLDDHLHINREGYSRWTAILKPMLMECVGLNRK